MRENWERTFGSSKGGCARLSSVRETRLQLSGLYVERSKKRTRDVPLGDEVGVTGPVTVGLCE